MRAMFLLISFGQITILRIICVIQWESQNAEIQKENCCQNNFGWFSLIKYLFCSILKEENFVLFHFIMLQTAFEFINHLHWSLQLI